MSDTTSEDHYEFSDQFDDDFDLQDPGNFDSDNNYFNIVNMEHVKASERRTVAEIADLFSIMVPMSTILLMAYFWNREKLSEEYIEGRALAKVGLTDADLEVQRKSGQKVQCSPRTCPICCDTYTRGFQLACKHTACIKCYERYLGEKLSSGDLLSTRCLGQHDCRLVATLDDFRELSKDLESGYLEKTAASYLQSHSSSFKACPGPGCTSIIELTSSLAMLDLDQYMVECSCGKRFCLGCKNDWHLPIKCDLASRWMNINGERMKNNLWLDKNTKPCPKCEARIERTEGCNHMKCRTCHFEYCWMCMQEWSAHNGMFFKCVHFQPSAEAKHSGRATSARLKHYSIRFDSNIIDSRRDVNVRDLTFSSQQVLNKAVPTLSYTRRILAWTYVLLFYVTGSNQKTILETSVSDIESHAETLAELLAGDEQAAAPCLELSGYLETRVENLITHALETNWKLDRNSLTYTPS